MCAAGKGAVLLGELKKYVAVSANRFEKISCAAGGVGFTLKGEAGEVVSVTTIVGANDAATATVVVQDHTIPAGGVLEVCA